MIILKVRQRVVSYIIKIMNKYQRKKFNNKPQKTVEALHHHLFGKLKEIQHQTHPKYLAFDNNFSQFEQTSTPYSHQLLQKAKKTYSNKGKIERMRNQIKRMQQAQTGDFMTGVGLYIQQPQQEHTYPIDEDSLMRNLKDSKYDDLQELRRMIKRTENNLKQYSQSVYNTQTQIVSAADKCGRQIDVGLAIKINRCGLDRTFYKTKKSKIETIQNETLQRRTMSSYNPRRNRF